MDFSKIKNIYMIGIKGVGMTMLAQFLHNNGKKIFGSDTAEKFMTDKVLDKLGINIFEEFSGNHLTKDIDLIIYSTAYNKDNNVEVNLAFKNGFKVLTYAEALGTVFNTMDGIAVCGSHGKTTTSAWLGFVLSQCGLEPNVMVGARVPQFNSAGLNGKSNYLVIEADEYQNKLQYFNPRMVLLNNIDYDHPDFYKTEEEYLAAFKVFIKKIPKRGFLVANFDDEKIKEISSNLESKVIFYSLEEKRTDENSYFATNIKSENSLTSNQPKQYFKVYKGEEDLGVFSISLLGKHNIYNALAVIATSIELGVDLFLLRKSLEEFLGTERRMQFLGEFNEAKIIDDYAHHPSEIRASLEAIKSNYPHKNLITIFSPHTFSRTKIFFNDFVESFEFTDELVILDIYSSAREEKGDISSEDLVKAINKKNNKAIYIASLQECADYLKGKINKNDLVLLMGAGDVFRVKDILDKN